MMERLTEKVFGFVQLKACENDFCKETCAEHDGEKSCKNCHIQKAFEKLAQYEDLEEQGLLLRLPCKVGGMVFKLKQHNYCPTGSGICHKDISCSECRANTPFGIVEGKFMLKELKEIGKTVFLTQAEAEQKLKEMESEQDGNT